jgi:D-alanyl-D-alanine-carboxypeptidase/D-alanyl-D-alanine-endopeptidase
MGWDRFIRIASRLTVAVGLSALIALSSAPAPAQAPLLNETLELPGTVLFLESRAPGLVIGAVRNGETGD